MNTENTHIRRAWQWLGTVLLLVVLPGCELRQAMYDQEKYEPMETSTFFTDGQADRLPIEGTVARGQLRLDSHLYTGKVDGQLVTTLPLPLTRERLERGRERYDIFCSPCHDRTGSGIGMIVQRGFKRPPSFHQQRLREVPLGHFYDVITNGFGSMYNYASRIPVEDRWAIAAYVRTLQLSQNVDYDQLTEADQSKLP